MKSRKWNAAASWMIAIGGTAAVTQIGRAMNLNPSTMGFPFLIVVLVASLCGGLLVGTVASIVATPCYNFQLKAVAGIAGETDGNLLAGAVTDVAQRGLGLEMARSLAASNDGRIGITPRQGGGTIARLDVPAAPLPPQEPT